MLSRLAVFVSQGPSDHPAKRQLEASLVSVLRYEPEIDVALVPHLYDLQPRHPAATAIRNTPGDLVVISWLYERATRWVLHASGLRGHVGHSHLETAAPGTEHATEREPTAWNRGAADGTIPTRRIYCLDLKLHTQAEPFVREIQRIARERRGAQPPPLRETVTTLPAASTTPVEPVAVNRDAASVARRWYPVIDYGRCTNCMECIDFCLFGVYGVDEAEAILVEQPDQCRKGCPACSRVCPENAIIFPLHKTPAIAGAPGDVAPLKVDLSPLFGAPEPSGDARQLAITERQEHLEHMPRPEESHPDALDRLLDALDEFD